MKYLLILTVLSVVIFGLFPEIDLRVSEFFYEKDSGGFIYKKHPATMFFYDLIKVLTHIIIIGLFSLLLTKKFWKKPSFPTNRHIVFLLIVLAIGPGLIVHQGFKDNWGRARPFDSFAGEKFTPVTEISNQGGKSFMSGHTAMGFYMVAFSFLWYGSRRKKIYFATLGFGTFIGMVRIIQGGHFLSDVVLTALLILIIIHLCYRWILREHNP